MVNERRTDPPHGGRAGGRCLLWVPVGHDAPLALLDGLRQRQVTVSEVIDAPAAMSALANGRHRMLVIVEPRALRTPQRLVAAARRYCDNLVIWRYAQDDDPPLQPWRETDDPPAAEPIKRLMTVAEPVEVEAAPAHSTQRKLAPIEPATISQDELAMLLDDGEATDVPGAKP